MNVKPDSAPGPILKFRAGRAEDFYSDSDGGEHGAAKNMIRFAKAIGLNPVVRNQSGFGYGDCHAVHFYWQDLRLQWSHCALSALHGEGLKIGEWPIVCTRSTYQNLQVDSDPS